MNFFTDDNKKGIEILHNLKEIIDPEVTINIVDMGLVYKVVYSGTEKTIDFTMTLSSKGCPMGDLIMGQMKDCLTRYYPDCTIELHLVWEPAWTRDFITPDGRKQLGIS